MNLRPLLTERQIAEALESLKRKKFRKDFSSEKRFVDLDDRHLNALGEYLELTNSENFYNQELERFAFLPYLGLKIEKSKNKFRPLLIPEPKDRVILTAIFPFVRSILKPDLEKYGALGLGLNDTENTAECKRVLTEIKNRLKSGESNFILKLDFKDFFSSIDRKILLRKLNGHFKGKEQRRLFRFIKESITNRIEADPDFHGRFGHLKLRTTGIPQGLSYSPLLASFFALSLDKATLRFKTCKSFRYLDDMIILAKTEKEAKKVYEFLKLRSEKLELNLHQLKPDSKTQLLDFSKDKLEFLGIGIAKDRLFIPDEAINDFKETFKTEILNAGIVTKFSLIEVTRAYKNFAKGWVNHYKSLCPEHFEEVEVELTNFMDQYIEKHSTRKTIRKFFGPLRLTLSGHFLRLKT